MSVAPLVVEGDIVVVFGSVKDGFGNAIGEVGGGEEVTGSVKESHSAVNAYADIDPIAGGETDYKLHIVEVVPR